MAAKGKASDRAKEIIGARGVIRTAEAIRAGIHPRTLYDLRDKGDLEQIARGAYRIAGPPIGNPDLVVVVIRVPRAVLCLVSALAFHEITTQVPHAVSIAIPRGAATPRIDHPPLAVHRFSGAAMTAGIEEHDVDGVPIKVYSLEKSIADCFKFRNKIGMDVVLEALKLYKARKTPNPDELLEYGKICGVAKVMHPYLEAILD